MTRVWIFSFARGRRPGGSVSPSQRSSGWTGRGGSGSCAQWGTSAASPSQRCTGSWANGNSVCPSSTLGSPPTARKKTWSDRRNGSNALSPEAEIHTDIRSGLKFDRPGFLAVLKAVQERRVSRVVVAYEDRLARFGVDLLRQVFAAYGTTLEVLDPKPKETPESELANDLIAIITSFSARLYGLRSHKTKRLLSEARKAMKDP